MKISDLLTIKTIDLNAKASNRIDAINKAIKLIDKSGSIKDLKTYKKGVFARENEMSTNMGNGIAIPHCKSPAVKNISIAVLNLKKSINFKSSNDEKVNLIFLIAAPDDNNDLYLDVLARLSSILVHKEFVYALKASKSPYTFLSVLDYAEETIKTLKKDSAPNKYTSILAVTACPTGIAHSFAAEEALNKAAKKMNVSIKVEAHGINGAKETFTKEEIDHADGIIVASDVSVDMDRFKGKRLIQVPVERAIKDPSQLIDMALDPITSVYGSNKIMKQDQKQKGGPFKIFYRHLISGISHMIPFIIAGGVLLAIAYIIDACSVPVDVTDEAGNFIFGNATMGAKIFHMLGSDIAIGLMYPILAGFIAYSIADKAGLVAGFVGGVAACRGEFSLLYFIEISKNGTTSELAKQLSSTASGILGAIIAGFLAGYIIIGINKLMNRGSTKTFFSVSSVIISPLLSTFIVGCLMLLINVPLAYINIGVKTGIDLLADQRLTILVAALASGLMAIDMGGPIAHATHYAILGLILKDVQDPYAQMMMAANIVGIMVPPLSIVLAAYLFPQKFEQGDRRASIANVFTGLFGISEGAIPYLAKDPIRIIISSVIGATVGGIICCSLRGLAIAPEGGIVSVAMMGGIFWKVLISVIIATIISALLLGILKKNVTKEEAKLGQWKGLSSELVIQISGKISKKIKLLVNTKRRKI